MDICILLIAPHAHVELSVIVRTYVEDFEIILENVLIIQNVRLRFWRTACNEKLRNFYPLQFIIK